MQIVGYEGLWGTLMICVCLVIANFLPGAITLLYVCSLLASRSIPGVDVCIH